MRCDAATSDSRDWAHAAAFKPDHIDSELLQPALAAQLTHAKSSLYDCRLKLLSDFPAPL